MTRWETLEQGDVQALAEAVSKQLGDVAPQRVHEAVRAAVATLAGDELGLDLGHLVNQLIETPHDDDAAAALDRAEDELRAAGRWEDVVDVYLARVAAATDSPSRAVHLAGLGDVLELELDDADRALTATLEAFHELPDARFLGALVRRARATERWDELATCLTDGVAAADLSDQLSILRTLATIYAEHVDDSAAEIDCLEQLRAVVAPDAALLTRLAGLYERAGKLRNRIDVLAALADATEDLTERADLYRNMAAECERFGDVDRAAEFYEWALSCEPDDGAFRSLQRLYKNAARWRAAVDVYCRHAEVAATSVRGELYAAVARIYEQQLGDASRAVDFYVKATATELGEIDQGEPLLLAVLDRVDNNPLRARLLVQVARLREAAGDPAEAIRRYREALNADAEVPSARDALVQLYTRQRMLEPLAAELAILAARTPSIERERDLLRRLADTARALGNNAEAVRALRRLTELNEDDHVCRLELVALLLAEADWQGAQEILTDTLERFEERLPIADCVEARYHLGRCELRGKRRDEAHRQFCMALALDPHHRPSLLARMELDADDPQQLIVDKLALVESSTPDEAAALLTEVGDMYANALNDPITAREMYRDALAYAPTDHVLLNKCLGLVVEQNDWSRSRDMLERLIETEHDPRVRAKYRHVYAMVLRQRLGRDTEAAQMLRDALADDPSAVRIARELEGLLRDLGDTRALARHFYARVEALRGLDGMDAERVHAWTSLGEVCMERGLGDDALCAFEVAANLEPDNIARRKRLANLYFNAGPDYYAKAIEQHRAILRADNRCIASYHALGGLYRLTEQPIMQRACADVVAVLGLGDEEPAAVAPLDVEQAAAAIDGATWGQVANHRVDRMLSILFAIAAPAFAERYALSLQQLGLKRRNLLAGADRRPFARLLRFVAARIGVDLPDVYLRPEQNTACRVALCRDVRGVVPVVMIGRAASDGHFDQRALAFAFARQLADLKSDRRGRLVMRTATELTRIIEAAVALAAGEADSTAAQAMRRTLSAMDLDQLQTIGERLGERKVDAQAAAVAWLDATAWGAIRAGYVIAGNFSACARVLEAEPGSERPGRELIAELAAATITDDALGHALSQPAAEARAA